MKLHRTLVLAVTETIHRIFSEGMYADKAVEQVLKSNSRFGSRDRRFIAENVYGMVRWWRLINESAEKKDDLFHLFAVWMLIKGEEVPDWDEFKTINKEEILSKHSEANKIRKIRESLPDWLDELGSNELGAENWEAEVHELNKEAQVVLRVNRIKTNAVQLKKLLQEQSIETFPLGAHPDALVLVKRQSLQQLNEYKQGLFEVQDASSQLIAPFMELQENMTVVDACAGAGGKSLHIATMMQNRGRIISMDVEERKLLELKKRAERGGVNIIQTQLVNSSAINKLKNSADRLLLDVPCSGLG
ncbi:MAG: class I SAM-dependent methyltransferase, partial [Bacteroidetes bacterium]|nr:class I SAM-dependent methyltransferase [Bacteroidota bacterium]